MMRSTTRPMRPKPLMPTLIAIMIILHRKCDRIVRSSRPVIAESLYHGVFFCLPLFGKKVAELCCTNVCKTDKNSEKHLSNFSKYSIHLKHSKHPFVQKIALYRTKMTANLQNENDPLWGPFYFSLNSMEAHFEPSARNKPTSPTRISCSARNS